MANRIQELEREVKELREQILTLALRQPVIMAPPVIPQPSTQPPFYPTYPTIIGGEVMYSNDKSHLDVQ